jgi:hypothetical protein
MINGREDRARRHKDSSPHWSAENGKMEALQKVIADVGTFQGITARKDKRSGELCMRCTEGSRTISA